MNYVELTIGKKDYKLSLNIANSIQLEKALGYNPIDMFMKMDQGTLPKIADILLVFKFSLVRYQEKYSMEKISELWDEYCEGGGSVIDFIPVMVEIFQNAGIITKAKDEDEEKN